MKETKESLKTSVSKTIAIIGPTASGKSSLAMRIAEEIAGEIVCCDSVQLYRGFDIGSAKANLVDQKHVPHHMLNVADWNNPYDAARYALEAEACISAIHSRKKVAIVCGGTGLYLRALRFGLIDVPKSDPQRRHHYETEEAKISGSQYRRLLKIDKETAERIEPNNLVQVIRALEIFDVSGHLASELREEHAFKQPRTSMRVYCLDWEREELRARIQKRTEQMLEFGFIDEVRTLLAAGVDRKCAAMHAVGYRQVSAYLCGELKEELLQEKIAQATARYAKQQRTWNRSARELVHIEIKSAHEKKMRDAALATILSELNF